MNNGAVECKLRQWLENMERIAVVGVGNRFRSDDFVGVVVVQGLKGLVDKKRVLLVESETVPESFLDEIAGFQPSHVLVVDAGFAGLKAGDVKFLKDASAYLEVRNPVSTHALPLRIFCEYLRKVAECKVGLLIIQPMKTRFGNELSDKVRKTAENLAKTLAQMLGES